MIRFVGRDMLIVEHHGRFLTPLSSNLSRRERGVGDVKLFFPLCRQLGNLFFLLLPADDCRRERCAQKRGKAIFRRKKEERDRKVVQSDSRRVVV